MVIFGFKSGCFRAKWFYSRLYWDKNGCLRAKVVIFGQKGLYSGKVVVFDCVRAKISAKVVVFGYSGKALGQKWLYFGKFV